MTTIDPEKIESILATDCGSTTTKAILIEKKDGEYRLIVRGEAPTTVEKPAEDVTMGVLNAVSEVQELAGRQILDGMKMIKPKQGDKGVDIYDTQTDQWSARIMRGCSPASVDIAKDLGTASAFGDVDVELEECADDECQVVGSDTLTVRLRVDGYGDISSSRGSWVDTFGTCRAAGNYRGTFNEGEASASIDGAAAEVGYGHIAKGRSKFSLRCGG